MPSAFVSFEAIGEAGGWEGVGGYHRICFDRFGKEAPGISSVITHDCAREVLPVSFPF